MAWIKKGWEGAEPMMSLEIPVGVVRRRKAGRESRGSRGRMQPFLEKKLSVERPSS
jgi:hypothetical protein